MTNNLKTILFSKDNPHNTISDMKFILPLLSLVVSSPLLSGVTVIYSEDFESATATMGYASTTNAVIGNSSLYNRNGSRAFITTADAAFTNATGNVAQIGSHTAGGFALVSVPLLGGAAVAPQSGTDPALISVPALTIGDTFTISFDIFTQTLPTGGGTPAIIWNSNNSTIPNNSWTEYMPGATLGQYTVIATHTVTASTVGVTSIGPQIQLLNGTNATGGFSTSVNENMVQLDNISVTHTAIPEPSASFLLGLASLTLLRRSRKR